MHINSGLQVLLGSLVARTLIINIVAHKLHLVSLHPAPSSAFSLSAEAFSLFALSFSFALFFTSSHLE